MVFGMKYIPGSADIDKRPCQHGVQIDAEAIALAMKNAEHMFAMCWNVLSVKRWCPSALLDSGMLLVCDLATTNVHVQGQSDEDRAHPGFRVSYELFCELTSQLKLRLTRRDWVIQSAKDQCCADYFENQRDFEDDRRRTLAINAVFTSLQKFLKDGPDESAPTGKTKTSTQEWLSKPWHQRVYQAAIVDVLADQNFKRLERYGMLQGVALEKRAAVLDDMASKAVDVLVAIYHGADQRKTIPDKAVRQRQV